MSRCIAIDHTQGGHLRRCRQVAVLGHYCQEHAEVLLDGIPEPSPHVCTRHRICEMFLRERFGEEAREP